MSRLEVPSFAASGSIARQWVRTILTWSAAGGGAARGSGQLRAAVTYRRDLKRGDPVPPQVGFAVGETPLRFPARTGDGGGVAWRDRRALDSGPAGATLFNCAA